MATGAILIDKRGYAAAVGNVVRVAGGAAGTAVYGTGLYPPLDKELLCVVERITTGRHYGNAKRMDVDRLPDDAGRRIAGNNTLLHDVGIAIEGVARLVCRRAMAAIGSTGGDEDGQDVVLETDVGVAGALGNRHDIRVVGA